MKIGVLTFHRAENYGAVLQAYALKTFLREDLYDSTEIIDYKCSKIEDTYSYKSFIFNGNPIKIVAKILLRFRNVFFTKRKFRRFRKNYLNVSSKTYVQSQIDELIDDYDCIVVGSDQVFNRKVTGNDIGFFLQGKREHKSMTVKVPYAASIGSLPDLEEQKEEILSYLRNFEMLSVREQSFCDWLVKNGREASVHVDPVLLLNQKDWDCLTVPFQRENYILYFNVQDLTKEQKTIEFAKRLAREKKCDLLHISAHGSIRDHAFKKIKNASPNEFITYIKNADYIITDSFHGTVFSLIFHKQFFSEVHIEHPSRIVDLLTLTELKDRALQEGTPLSDGTITDEKWDQIDELFVQKRNETREYFCNKKEGCYIPVLYKSKNNCCGCSLCYSLCPVKAIQMEADEEGFLYPKIDLSKCIKCLTCFNQCTFQNSQREKNLEEIGE